MSYYRIIPNFIFIFTTILCDRLLISNNYENEYESNCDTKIFSYDIWAFHFRHIYFLSQSQVHHGRTGYSQFNSGKSMTREDRILKNENEDVKCDQYIRSLSFTFSFFLFINFIKILKHSQ